MNLAEQAIAMGNSRRVKGNRGGSSDGISACENVSIECLVNPTNAMALAAVSEDDVVQVVLDPTSSRPIVTVWRGADLLGSLTVTDIDKLIECLRAGFTFHGVVLEAQGALCRIRVRSGEGPR